MAIIMNIKGSGGVNPNTLLEVEEGQIYKLLKFVEWSRMEQIPDNRDNPPPIKLFEGMATMQKEGGKRKRRYCVQIKTDMQTKKIRPSRYKAEENNVYGVVLKKIPVRKK